MKACLVCFNAILKFIRNVMINELTPKSYFHCLPLANRFFLLTDLATCDEIEAFDRNYFVLIKFVNESVLSKAESRFAVGRIEQ